MVKQTVSIVVALLLLGTFVSCTSNRDSSMALHCSSGLDAAYKEMEDAEAKGFRSAVGLTKAASLLAAAKVQYEFKRYPNCVDKVRRARIHIAQAQSG